MAFLIPVATAIYTAITSTVAIVASVVAGIVSTVVTIVAAIARTVASVVIPIVSGIVSVFSGVGYTIGSYIEDVASWLATEGQTLYTTLKDWTHAVNSCLKGILEAIHFKTILEVHNIAMLVSSDYRDMMKRVYDGIGEASKALGFGPEFLALAIQNSRALVLDASSAMGHKYDLSQVQWLQSLSSWLNRVNTVAETYEKNPEAVFYDLAQLIDKPAMDAKGSFTQVLVQAVSDATDITNKIVRELTTMGQDLDKWASDLPKFIKDQVQPLIHGFTGPLQDAIKTYYDPIIADIKGSIEEYNKAKEKIEQNVGGIVERLKNPGTYLKEIDGLPADQKTEAELTLADIASRSLQPWTLGIYAARQALDQQFNQQLATPTPTISAPSVLLLEPIGVAPPQPGALIPRASWFVGDF